MITDHQYLNRYPIPPESELLIVGTIHPHEHNAFVVPFFYGNVLSIWNILSDAFPVDLPRPITLEKILSFLNSRRIGISDTIVKCQRTNPTALDEHLIPLKLHEAIVDQIKASSIKRILFTSGFGKNNAFKLFYEDILGQRLTRQIKANRSVVLDDKFFGRPMELVALYSPSGSANRSLPKTVLYKANMHKYVGHKTPVAAFKIDYYRSQFSEPV